MLCPWRDGFWDSGVVNGGSVIMGMLGNPVWLIDPEGLWAISFDTYGGIGGGVTIGKSDAGTWFVNGRLGIGLGGGANAYK